MADFLRSNYYYYYYRALEYGWGERNRDSEINIGKQRSWPLESTIILQSGLAPRIQMSFRKFCFISLLCSPFFVALCVPQVPGQALNVNSNDGDSENVVSSIPPGNVAVLPDTSSQDNAISVALNGNGLDTMHSTESTPLGAEFLGGDPGGTNFKSWVHNAVLKH